MKPATILAVVLVVFALGIFIGWRAGGSSSAKAEATAADARTDAITAGVSKGLARRQADLTAQQGQTLALQKDQAGTHAAMADIHLEISNARFDLPANAGVCPDPVGSDDFVRLYNGAATAHRTTGDSASASSR
jgi:hypothetical protein